MVVVKLLVSCRAKGLRPFLKGRLPEDTMHACSPGPAACAALTLLKVSSWSSQFRLSLIMQRLFLPAAGCDVLWGGCPIVTLPLERMASRVAASLCYATGLGPEMVVRSQQVSAACQPLERWCRVSCRPAELPLCSALSMLTACAEARLPGKGHELRCHPHRMPACQPLGTVHHLHCQALPASCAVMPTDCLLITCAALLETCPALSARLPTLRHILHTTAIPLQEYEEKAVELGLNHEKRLDLRRRLKDARLTCPLFDTTQWVQDLEKVYFKMWDIHCEGRGPRTFDIQ